MIGDLPLVDLSAVPYGAPMRYLVLCLALTGCTSASGSLVPIKAVGSVSGDASGPQVFIAGVPVNALLKVHGSITYTVQPMPPYLTYDGDYTIIVEPVAGREQEAIDAVTRGDILIRRDGKAGALNAVGTRAAYIDALIQKSKAQPAPIAVADTCVGGTCSLPK